MPTERNCLVLALLAFAAPASAGITLSPYAVAGYEYDANVLGFADRTEALQQTGDDKLDDTIQQAGIGVLTSWDYASTALTLQAEARRIEYDRLGTLDHDAHRVLLRYRGQLGSTLMPQASFGDERRMAPLGERGSTELLLERERTASVSANWEALTRWWLEPAIGWRDLDSPLPEDAGFGLRENSASLALRRMGSGAMSFGVIGGFTDGDYRGAEAQQFRQTSAELLYEYNPTVQSRFTAKFGYASRDDDRDDDDARSTVGSLALQHQLTGLTTVDVTAFRRIASYASGVSAVIETGMRASIRWQATVATGVLLDGGWIDSDYDDPFADVDARDDRDLVSSLRIEFQPRRWLTIQPYAEYRDRDSSIASESFDGYAAGVKIRAMLNPPADMRMLVLDQ